MAQKKRLTKKLRKMKVIFSSSKIYNNVCVNMSSPPRSPSSLNLPPRLSGSVQQSLSFNICFVLFLLFFFVFLAPPRLSGSVQQSLSFNNFFCFSSLFLAPFQAIWISYTVSSFLYNFFISVQQ